MLRSGAHWRDLPERYGKWKMVHRRFSRWCHAGVWSGSLMHSLLIGTLNDRQHHRACPSTGCERKRGAKDQALGRSRGGLRAKVHMLVDA
ncbi:transposase [Rhizobium laguerreae]|nr:transposase [Rhizobium laguerreae]MBY5579341.1 transposase [Rhizobium leguminosarum]MBY3211019.1 transposase [Rhizobium laguerreae]MBY3348214.1 transposase [Rhizobium laguerreae]MBY3355064.1 transposase [Rhizobium laguerreae]